MQRKLFLIEFLGALGAEEIHWNNELEGSISGAVIYELDDPEETQDFIWHKKESEVPVKEIFELAALLNENNLLNIDKIKVSRQELRKQLETKNCYTVSEPEFITILETLKSIEVSMVDDGEETDIYFIHE